MYSRSDLMILREFKSELEAYEYLKPRVKVLQENILVLQARFGPHSPQMGGVQATGPQDHDAKLAQYIQQKERYERDLETFLGITRRVENILNLMPDDKMKYVEDVYSKNKTLQQVANESGYNLKSMEQIIDLTIIKAVKKYETVD
jgi:hypothetical protein